MKTSKLLSVVLLLSLFSFVGSVKAQEGLDPLTEYTQDFNTLASTPEGGTADTGIPNGWVFVEFNSNADTNYRIDDGSGNTGDTYSYGPEGDNDRAFGALNSGSLQTTIGVKFQNNTGGTIGELSIQYYCEQWRQGATGRTDRMDFQYSVDATSVIDGTATWTDFDDLDCTGTDTGSTGAKDGNITKTLINANITGLSIDNGNTFWLRWKTHDASGADDGLAIDDFVMTEFNPNAITLSNLNAASPVLSLSAALVLAGAVVVLRKRR